MADDVPEGELFSRLYFERGAPMRDSMTFRTRLSAYLEQNHWHDFREIAEFIKRELGLVVPPRGGTMAVYYDVPGFVMSTRIHSLCDSITLIWRLIEEKNRPHAIRWIRFVARALREENLGYSIDEHGGIHYFVDEEFERNRVSALRAAGAPRYAAVRAEFENAHAHLDADPPDTKASIRSMFEALEILAKLMEPGIQRLNRRFITDNLTHSATWLSIDAIEIEALGHVFEGMADWVDAMHMYRHGQAVEEPNAPSMEFAVYALSSGAAILRLLLGIDASPGGVGHIATRA